VKLDGAREIYFIEAIACTDCGDCVAVCPVEAIAPVD
jgi:ferredoxin